MKIISTLISPVSSVTFFAFYISRFIENFQIGMVNTQQGVSQFPFKFSAYQAIFLIFSADFGIELSASTYSHKFLNLIPVNSGVLVYKSYCFVQSSREWVLSAIATIVARRQDLLKRGVFHLLRSNWDFTLRDFLRETDLDTTALLLQFLVLLANFYESIFLILPLKQ